MLDGTREGGKSGGGEEWCASDAENVHISLPYTVVKAGLGRGCGGMPPIEFITKQY